MTSVSMPLPPNEKTLLAKCLRDNRCDHRSFPNPEDDYYDRFVQIDKYLNDNIHKYVNQGATAKDGGWLTDHGPAHITTVMRRASDLVCGPPSNEPCLSPYEIYVLLIAIHFHDVGNVFGRDKHEEKITEVMRGVPNGILPDDAVERRAIRDIAMAHGGYFDAGNADRDTISPLPWTPSKDLRVPLLAAILRFADELADDYTRTGRFLIEGNVLPVGSEVYHVYADRLRRVEIDRDNDEIKVLFELDVEHVMKLYGKGEEKVYLYDEIKRRCVKMHLEHIYCLRFMQPFVKIDSIHVTVHISKDHFLKILHTISFRMQQKGYPKAPATDLPVDDGRSLRQTIDGLIDQPTVQ